MSTTTTTWAASFTHMLGYESIVIKTKIIVSSIIRVKNLPLKNANICTSAAVFVGVDTRYAILVREEFSCLEFIMNRDTINWILKN